VKDQRQSFGVSEGQQQERQENERDHPRLNASGGSISRLAGIDPLLQEETPLEAAKRECIETNTEIARDRSDAEVRWLDMQSDRVGEETSQSRILFLFSVGLGALFVGCLVVGVAANPQFLAGSWITSPVLIASIIGSLFRRPRNEDLRDGPR
jgi:hypothetical protein